MPKFMDRRTARAQPPIRLLTSAATGRIYESGFSTLSQSAVINQNPPLVLLLSAISPCPSDAVPWVRATAGRRATRLAGAVLSRTPKPKMDNARRSGERTPLACSFRRPAENFVPLTFSGGGLVRPGNDGLGGPPKPARGPRALPDWFRSLGLLLLGMLFVASAAAAEKVEREGRAAELQPVLVGAVTRVVVHPAAVKLAGARARAQVVVTGFYADGAMQDLTRAARIESADAKVARVEAGWVSPVGDGRTELRVSVGGRETRVPVEVAAQGAAAPVGFKYGVLAALSKQGCNSGGCHGTPSGKGGFALSLFAFDPEADKNALVREVFSRRINLLEPEASLLLRKPLAQVAHRGGQRLRAGEEAHGLLVDWINQGCAFDRAEAPACTGIVVHPGASRLLKWPAHTQQLQVMARFADGTERDITRLAMYASSDEAIATVTPEGLVVGQGRGQVAVSVRFLEDVETVGFTFVRDIEGFVWQAPPVSNFIDTLVQAKLRQLQFLPSEPATDEEFVRRVYLDVIGLLPTLAETRRFLGDVAKDKRARLIDELLARPEFPRFWALKWGDWLRLNPTALGAGGVHKFHRWLVRAFEVNQPYDQFVRELLLADGSTLENPAANYYRTAATGSDATETTAQIFLGVRIQCARCHNHPFERWTQDNYYGMNAVFERLQRQPGNRAGEQIIWVARRGEVMQPRTGKEMKPWAPNRGEMNLPPEADRRAAFVEWLTQPTNAFFARAEANRIWAQVMGQGIVEPIDDFRDSNPPSNVELLDALAKEFATQRFDRKQLLRTILNSRTYQTSSTPNRFNHDDRQFFSRYRQRLLTAEQLLDAVCQVSGLPETFANLPPGTLATQLPAPEANNAFLSTFGQPPRQTACACERPTTTHLGQALQLFNGPLLHGKLQSANNQWRKQIAEGRKDGEIIADLYRAALCRPPTDSELATATRYVAGRADRGAALSDVAWSVLNLNEFLFQH